MPESNPHTMHTRFAPHVLAAMYQAFMLIRIIGSVATAGGVWVLWVFGILHFSPLPILIGVIPALIISNSAWMLILKRPSLAHFGLYAQLFFDLLFITIGIYFSGGIHSQFIFFYLFVIISASIISSQAVYLYGFGAFVFYSVLVVGEHYQFITPILEARTGFDDDDIIRFTVFYLVTMIIGFQSYYYISRIREIEKEVAKVKDDFFFRAVHDLRSPLNGIRWIVEKYSQPHISQTDQSLHDDIATIKAASERTLRLLKDLSAIIQGGKTEVVVLQQPVDLTSIIKETISEVAATAARMRIAIHYHESANKLYIRGDAYALKEVLANILDNALKYNMPGGSINITHELSDHSIATIIQDTGVGITAEDQKRIFTPYFRGVAEKTNITGTGLGLYIVKGLLTKMNGAIVIHSEPGKGTTCRIKLVAAPNQHPTA